MAGVNYNKSGIVRMNEIFLSMLRIVIHNFTKGQSRAHCAHGT